MKKLSLEDSAKKALFQLKNGNLYKTADVVNRLSAASKKHPTDSTINYTKDFFESKLGSNLFVTQKEIGEIFDTYVGLGGGDKFRHELGDLLPANRQLAEITRTASALRVDTGHTLELDYGNQALTDAFTTLFGLGGSGKVATHKIAPERGVKKVVIATLGSLGNMPKEVIINTENAHFTLCSAMYRTNGHNDASVQVIVPTTNGVARIPEKIAVGGIVADLNRENLFFAIKEAKHIRKTAGQAEVASQRAVSNLNLDKAGPLYGVNEFDDVGVRVIAAANHHSPKDISNVIKALDVELSNIGLNRSQIKLGSASKTNLVFDAVLATPEGQMLVQVPIEIIDKRMNLPTSFSMKVSAGETKNFDFSRSGVEKFNKSISAGSLSSKIARETGSMSMMTIHQLKDLIIKGASNKNYRISEDAIALIETKFGHEQAKNAYDLYSKLLIHEGSNSESETRDKNVSAAIKRNDLIKIATTIEWYCPKLGLPLSKISFDHKGRPIPFRRSIQSKVCIDSEIDNLKIAIEE